MNLTEDTRRKGDTQDRSLREREGPKLFLTSTYFPFMEVENSQIKQF